MPCWHRWKKLFGCFAKNRACLFALVLAGCNAPPLRPSATAEPLNIGDTGQQRPQSDSPANVADEAPALYHQVRPGEKLSDIAAIYGTSAPRLLQTNGLDTGAPIKPGQLIYIPPQR